VRVGSGSAVWPGLLGWVTGLVVDDDLEGGLGAGGVGAGAEPGTGCRGRRPAGAVTVHAADHVPGRPHLPDPRRGAALEVVVGVVGEVGGGDPSVVRGDDPGGGDRWAPPRRSPPRRPGGPAGRRADRRGRGGQRGVDVLWGRRRARGGLAGARRCARPVGVEDQGDPARRAGRRDPMRPAGSPRRQVKWLLRPAFEQWRDVGLWTPRSSTACTAPACAWPSGPAHQPGPPDPPQQTQQHHREHVVGSYHHRRERSTPVATCHPGHVAHDNHRGGPEQPIKQRVCAVGRSASYDTSAAEPPRGAPLARATFMPSRVLSRARSASNSAIMLGRVVDRPADGELHGASRELVGDRAGVGHRPGESIELGHDQGVARQGASASRRPGRARLMPASP